MNNKVVKIGCGQGFWGDWLEGPKRLVEKGGLDYLILDYLAEVTMSVLAKQKTRRPEFGFGRDLPILLKEIAPSILNGKLKVVTNGGGLNPRGCAEAVVQMFKTNFPNAPIPKIAFVEGDDLTNSISALQAKGEKFSHLESGAPFSAISDRMISMNAYTGSEGVVEALDAGAQIVLTGRVADPSLCLGPLLHEFSWPRSDYNLLAAGIIAGHVIECGTQSSGGNYSLGWENIKNPADIGYPIVEVSSNGTLTVTKPVGTGGEVSVATVTEQLVYEIGDPQNYMTPDVIADFTSLEVTQEAPDRVVVRGAKGKPPPSTLKISGTYRDGFKAEGTLVLVGPKVFSKAAVCRMMIEERLRLTGITLEELYFENIGSFDCIPGMAAKRLYPEPGELLFRVAARDADEKKLERFTREIAPLVLSGPSGITGYAGGKGEVKEVVSFWPSLVTRENVPYRWEIVS